MRKTLFCLLAICTLATAQISAQTQPKYGHMNLGNLLESLPDTKKANDDLKVIADRLGVEDSLKIKTFTEEYTKFEADYKAGLLTPIVAQQKQAELQKQQEAIQAFEQQAQQTISQKRDDLLNPIITRVQDAVKAVAKANGYLMVFDSSTGLMLFANEMDDVTALVKKQLGIN